MKTFVSKMLEVSMIWGILFVLIFLYYSPIATSNSIHDFLGNIILIYYLVVPIGIIRFVQKQSVIERFGLQSLRYLALAFVIIISLAIVFLSGIVNNLTAFSSIILAPIPEEIFFRGYMLGTLRSQKANLKLFLGSILLVSTTFAFSHSFKYDILGTAPVFALGFVFGVLYWFSHSIVPSATIHIAWNFMGDVKAEYQPSLSYVLWVVLLVMPLILVMIKENWRREKTLVIAKS
jgi:membrane protease YdiL (CAAX protease family)